MAGGRDSRHQTEENKSTVNRLQARLLLGLVAAACARSARVEPAAPAPLPEPAEAAPVGDLARPAAQPAEPHGPPPLSGLTVREKAAQLVMPWIGGEYWASDNDAMEEALRLATEEGVGGFVVGVGTSPYDLAAKFNALQRASRLPLLIAADLESGPSMRIRGGTAFPGNMALGATARELDAYEVGRVIALEGRAVGIHLVFAPVVDVNNNPLNPIINTRSFGEDPRRVGELAAAFVRGLAEHGMLSTAKHFPGHGDSETDSHLALPVIAAGRARLDSVELVPFRAAIAAGVDAVMSAHVAVPAFTGGSAAPATLSATVLDTLLRTGLGFRGLVVTDALNMGAIVARYGPAQAALLALRAGADVLLMPTDAGAAIAAIVAAVERGEVQQARLDSSVARLFAAKARAGLFRRRGVDVGAIAAAVGTREHAALARDITQRSLVLVRDGPALVPLPAGRRRRALVVAYADEGSTGAGTTLASALRAGVDTVSLFRLWPASGAASYDSVRAAARRPDVGAIVFLPASRPTAWRPNAVVIPDSLAALIEQLSAAGAPVIVASAGSPYILRQIPRAPSYLVAWAANEHAERAVAQALLGRAAIDGRLPVSLPPTHPIGTGLTRPAPAAPVAPAP
ncbi:MAG: glycoside hydrolase family 3 C-terminal domain-containing protein [Gemmatimonadetes bacterium]|nr:glycoside hydrolase family 3 C-terminal domain-containing protein [Gemmatimonadota bacterium]